MDGGGNGRNDYADVYGGCWLEYLAGKLVHTWKLYARSRHDEASSYFLTVVLLQCRLSTAFERPLKKLALRPSYGNRRMMKPGSSS
jgi:hypothetical protein